MKAKGAESRHLVSFCVDSLSKFENTIGEEGGHLLDAGLSLMMFYEIISTHHRKMDVGTQQELLSCAISHNLNYAAAGGHQVPKHHSMVHMTLNVCAAGKPAYYSMYQDESENGIIGYVGTAVHRSTFAISVFDASRCWSPSRDVCKVLGRTERGGGGGRGRRRRKDSTQH